MNKHRSNEHVSLLGEITEGSDTYSSRTYLDLFLTQSQDAKMSQVSVADASATSAVLSSNLLKGALTVFPSNGEQESICPKDELFFFLGSLNQYCSKKQKQLQPDKSWQKLLEEANPVKTETSTWNSYIGPILGFKLFNVLSGSSNVEGTIPRSVMSPPLRGAMNRIASFLTENQGWPKIFEDAIVARWNARTSSAPPPAPSTDTLSSSHSVPQTVAASVAKNLRNLSDTFRSKYHGNILNNIQLAASYLSIMSLGVIDIPMDEEFPAKLEECLRNAAFQSDDKFSDILTNLNLSLVAFQAPLFSSLAISPILLFRTCLLHSSRFGRHFYISFMLSLGDIKPASLREIETLIWKNLYLVARCQLSPQEMMDRVLDHIVEPQELESFKYDREKLRTYLNKKFDPIRDHTSFFHPDFGAIIKQELDPSFGRITTLSQKAVIPQPNPLFYDSSAALAQSGSSNLSPTTLRATGPVYDESGLRESGIGPAITASENSIVTGGVDLNSDGSSSVDHTHSDDAPISLTRDEVVGNASSPLSLPLPSPVHDAPGLDVIHIHEPMSSLPSGTPQPISAPTLSLTPRVSPSPGLDNNPPENFGPMSGLDSPSEDPRLLPDGNEIINPSGPEGAGGWNIPRATLVAMSGLNSPYEVPRLLPDSDEIANPSSLEGTGGWNIPQAIPVASLSQLDDSGGLDIPCTASDDGGEAIEHTSSNGSQFLVPSSGSRLVETTGVSNDDPFETHKSISGASSPSTHRLSLSPGPDENLHHEPISERSPSPTIHISPGRDCDPQVNHVPIVSRSNPRVILRKSSRISNKRLPETPDSDAPSPKRQKLSGGKKTRTKETTKEMDIISDNNDMDIEEAPKAGKEDGKNLPRLEVCGDKERKVSPVIHVYSADQTQYYGYQGKHYDSQIAEDLQELAAHVNAARKKNGFPIGKPLEWSDGMSSPVALLTPPKLSDDSPIYTMDFANFLKTSAKDLQNLFRRYPAIVVSGRPTHLKCDLASLEEWGGVDELREMHDNSRYDPKNAGSVFVLASYREFLQTSKNVNSLDNPLSGGTSAPTQLATDLRAAISVYGEFPSHIPVRIMNWGLLAKSDAAHSPHVDRAGTGTWVAIEDGLKKWDLAFPSKEAREEEFANPAAYGSEMVEGRNYARSWDWYSILLYPGTMLIMRPGTVHSVTTLQDCVALGGHFFSAPTIKYSLYSLFHTFVGSHTITNVSMDDEQQMLLRIILFWHKTICEGSSVYLEQIEQLGQETIAHVPNVLIFEDFLNLAMLLNYAELVLVLTPSRYSSPCPVSFEQTLYGLPRQRSRELRGWLLENFELVLDPPVQDGYNDKERLEQLLLKSLLGQAHTLWDSVKRREELGVYGVTITKGEKEREITAHQVLSAIEEDLSDFPGFTMWEDEPAPTSYSWPASPGSSCYVLKSKRTV